MKIGKKAIVEAGMQEMVNPSQGEKHVVSLTLSTARLSG